MEKSLRWEDLRLGDKTGPIQYTITEEIINAFAEATGDFGEWHMKASPFGDRIAHPALNITDYSLMLWRSHGRHTGLHARQESEYFQPLRLGDVITARGEIVELYQRRGRDFYTVQYEAFNQKGQLVTRNRLNTTVDRDEPTPPAAPAEGAGRGTAERQKVGQPGAGGPELAPLTRLFTRETMNRFASQTGLRMGQRGPVVSTHTDTELARRTGLPEVVAQATQYYAWYSETMLKFLGEGWVCGGRMAAKFFGMAFPGDALTIWGRVTGVQKEDAGTRVFVELEAVKHDGQPVSVATASGLAGKRTPAPGWPIREVPIVQRSP